MFAKAETFGLSGTENPDELTGNKELMQRFERFRLAVGMKLGFAASMEEVKVVCSNSPFLALISRPQDRAEYGSGNLHKADECDFHAFSLLDGMVHKSYQVTGSSCAAAACVPGTVVNQVCGKDGLKGTIRIGHPSGIMNVDVALTRSGDGFDVAEASLIRTARRVAEGRIFAAVDRLPWRPESGGKPRMLTAQPDDQKRLRNETFHAG